MKKYIFLIPVIFLLVYGCQKNNIEPEYNEPTLRFLEDFLNEYNNIHDTLILTETVIDTCISNQIFIEQKTQYFEFSTRLDNFIEQVANKRENNTYTESEKDELIELHNNSLAFKETVDNNKVTYNEIAEKNIDLYIALNILKKYYLVFIDNQIQSNDKINYVNTIITAYNNILADPNRNTYNYYLNYFNRATYEEFGSNINNLNSWFTGYITINNSITNIWDNYQNDHSYIQQPNIRDSIDNNLQLIRVLDNNSHQNNYSRFFSTEANDIDSTQSVNNQNLFYKIKFLKAAITWEQKSDFDGVARSNAISFVVNNNAYIGLGYDENHQDISDMWKYNVNSDTWTQLNDFPGGARSYSFAFVINDIAYVGGGIGSEYFSDLWQYNSTSDTWIQKANMPQSTSYYGVGFSINNKGYIVDYEGNLYEYTPETDSWISKSNFPGTLNYPFFTVINQKAYVGIGGETKEIWTYEPTADSWIIETTFPGKAWRLTTSIVKENNLYIIGGWKDAGNCQSEVWEYNTLNSNWTKLEDFPGGDRHSAISFSINNVGYFGTGNTSCGMIQPSKDIWKFEP